MKQDESPHLLTFSVIRCKLYGARWQGDRVPQAVFRLKA